LQLKSLFSADRKAK